LAERLTAVLVTEPDEAVPEVLGTVGRALQGGLSAIILRRPRSTAREVYDMTRQLRPATRRFGCKLIVSDRIDAAIAADADGVHLGRRSLPTAAARRILRQGMLLGRSTHDLDEAVHEEAAGVDYLFLGPVFATTSHPGATSLGLEHLREAVLRTSVPVVAIGGVDTGNVFDLARTDAVGAAAITAFSRAPDPAETARTFRAAFVR
jgi:thiamine-phosphate pyrophosphorylase